MPGEDWVSLFDGKTLDGWNKVGNESWTVEESLIHGKGLTKDYGYLETVKHYKDFQLSLRFKCVGDGNSGVFFHSAFKPGTADVTQGMQFEIDCTMMKHTAGVYAEDGRGWVVWPARKRRRRPHGRMERIFGRSPGNRYKSRLNGVPMVDFTDPKASSWDGTMPCSSTPAAAATWNLKTFGSAICRIAKSSYRAGTNSSAKPTLPYHLASH